MGGSGQVMPGLRYADAASAIDWLGKAFGFEQRMVIPGPDGAIAHAQLTLGSGPGMVMLGSGGGDSDYDKLVRPAGEAGGIVTASVYAVVDDVAAHRARAEAAGAEIVMAIGADQPEGPMYTCRDPEGNVWSFGTYDPFA